MSDVTTTINEKSVELQVRAYTALVGFVTAQAERMREERGQTAAEYLGVLVVVSVIIAAVAGTDVGDRIKNFINDVVGYIANGDNSKGKIGKDG